MHGSGGKPVEKGTGLDIRGFCESEHSGMTESYALMGG